MYLFDKKIQNVKGAKLI